MLVNYRVYSKAPDGMHELGRFETLSNAQAFMYAWAGLDWQYDPDCISVQDSDGWTCYIVDGHGRYASRHRLLTCAVHG